ncbi:hypothetical protein [Aliamphritea spongicola]|nr:hypothetical protein [Aliamphritea spongicola]
MQKRNEHITGSRLCTDTGRFNLTLAGGTHIDSPASNEIDPSFDILKARVVTDGSHLIFHQEARGTAGESVPKKLASSVVQKSTPTYGQPHWTAAPLVLKRIKAS